MMPKQVIQSRSILVLLTSLTGFALPANSATNARVSENYGKLPLHFEANRGQTDKDVRFLSRGAGYSLYLTAGEAVLVLAKPDAKAQGKSVALRMSLVGANRKPLVSGLKEQSGKANYFIGKDRSKWLTNVPTYAKVQYRDVYPGIDLVYYGNQRQLEYDFVVAPGADPKKIVLGFKGADKLEIDAQGDLMLHARGGDIRQHKPIIYQEIDGIRQELAGSYVRKGANRVGFQVAAYDRSRPLVIDPVVLSYSTYLGGERGEGAGGIAVDAEGNAYVTGITSSIAFPTTSGAFQPANALGRIAIDAFVTKLNPAGSALVYSTYLGGTGVENSGGIAVDAAGNAYVTGTTGSTDFPTTLGAFQPVFGGGSTFTEFEMASDAFVTKLNATGSALVYSTYLGGFDDDMGSAIAVDSAGSAYVAGQTLCAQSSRTPTTRCLNNFPTTPGAFQPITVTGGAGFVTKLNPGGSALVYSTFLGGSVNAVALDLDGNAYLSSSGVTPSPGAFQTIAGGGTDAGVTKLNAAGSALVYSSLLGGSGADVARGIAVDAAGNAYVTGTTTSPDFPTTPGAFQRTFAGGNSFGEDAFVTKLDTTGSTLIYSTYVGGSSDDEAFGIAVDEAGNAYVTGHTFSIDFPTTADAFQTTTGGDRDAYVTILNPAGSALVYSTYFGGTSIDQGTAIAVDANGNTYVTGVTNGPIFPATGDTLFPTTPSAFQTTFGGGCCDAFVAKFVGDVPPTPAPATTRSEESAATQIGFWTNYGAETGNFSGGSIVASNVATSTAIFSFTGTAVSWIGVKCSVCGIATVSIDGGLPITVNTSGPNAPGGLSSEPVFSASGLAAGASHSIAITVTGMSSSAGTYVAVDAFDVTAGGATAPLLPPVVLPPPPVVVSPLPPIPGL